MGSYTEPKLSIAICGGGIAGLTLLYGLLKYEHLDPIVYEATKAYGDVGRGMALHKNAIAAMESIDPAVRDAYFRSANSMAADDEVEMSTQVIMGEGPFSGEVLAHLGRAKGRKTVSRFDLLAAYKKLIPPERIKFGKRLQSIEELDHGRVRVTFEDGDSTTADCLISAEGIHSKTRHYLIGEDHPAANPVNHDNWIIVGRQVPTEDAMKVLSDKWTTFVPIVIGPEGYLNMMPLQNGKVWSISLVGTGDDSQANINTILNPSKWKSYDPEMAKAVSLVRDGPGEFVAWNLADHDAAPIYHRNNVVMIGDGAHATLPFIGNGAAQAIEDSAALHAIFEHVRSKEDIEPAFAAFENVRKERSQKVVEVSRQCGRIDRYQVDDVPGANFYTKEGVEAVKKAYGAIGKFTNEVDVGEQNAQAVKEFQRLRKTRAA